MGAFDYVAQALGRLVSGPEPEPRTAPERTTGRRPPPFEPAGGTPPPRPAGSVYRGDQRVSVEPPPPVEHPRPPMPRDQGQGRIGSSAPLPAPVAPSPWSPPILGRPGPTFRPKPSTAGSYRPDLVADGWSTPDFTVRAASARGYAHRFSGDPRQDDVAVFWHRPTGAVLFAVADGVGNAPLSHIGATSVCRAAISYMIDGLDSPEQGVDWSELLPTAAWQLCVQAQMSLNLPEVDQTAAEEQMATTLVAGCVRPGRDGPKVQFVQAGDSSAWILNVREGRYRCLAPTKYRRDQEVVSNTVSALPRVPRVPPDYVKEGIIAPDEILLVGTDGFGDPLGDGENVVGDHFATSLSDVPAVLKFANDLDFSIETWDDDRTLFALWPLRRAEAE